MPLFQYLKRKWIRRRPFPNQWLQVLQARVPVYQHLPKPAQRKLQDRIKIFMHEKLFEGCGGLTITLEMRVVIAAHACMLILEESSGHYPNLKSILVYPQDYMAPVYRVDTGGVVTEGWESRSGESWNPGNIVLSWGDIRTDLDNPDSRNNLIYHEFAHQLDYQYGLSAGIDGKGQTEREDEWTIELARTFRQLHRKAQRGEPDVLDRYGATNPAECFAVVTECFLQQPSALRRQYPELYRHLAEFYSFDPSSFIPQST